MAKPKTYTVDMRHYAELPDYAPPGTVKIAKFFGLIVGQVSIREKTGGRSWEMPCKLNPRRTRCKGRLATRLNPEHDDIEWRCPVCGDSGVITHWQGTSYNLGTWELEGAAELLLGESSASQPRKKIPPGTKLPVYFTKLEYKVLRGLTFLDPKLLTFPIVENGRLRFNLSLDDLDELQGCVAAEANHHDDPKMQFHCNKIFLKLDNLLEEYDDQDENV